MEEPRHAPGWRGRPRRIGPVVSDNDIPRWLTLLERIAPIGCLVMGVIALAIGGYVFVVDYLAGHIQ